MLTRLRACALDNLARWERQAEPAPVPFRIQVFAGDWGVVAGALTKRYGKCFAVLNMANALVPGGAYVEGAAAQEENMFPRSDCHFHIGPTDFTLHWLRGVPRWPASRAAWHPALPGIPRYPVDGGRAARLLVMVVAAAQAHI